MEHIAAVAMAAGLGCQFDESGLPGTDDAGLQPAPDAPMTDAAVAPPDASSGVPDASADVSDAAVITPDATSPDAACPPVVLEARKNYEPPFNEPDVRSFLFQPIDFLVPEHLQVTMGNAANHCSFLQWRHDGDSIACAYEGGADVAHVDGDPTQIQLGLTYHFVECRTGMNTMFPDCGDPGNSGQPSDVAPGDWASAEEIRLDVNGDSWEGMTEARVTLEGSCDPDFP